MIEELENGEKMVTNGEKLSQNGEKLERYHEKMERYWDDTAEMPANDENVGADEEAIKAEDIERRLIGGDDNAEFDEDVVDKKYFDVVKENALPGDKNTYIPIQMVDGSKEYLTCTFLRIYKLKGVMPKFYQKYNQIMINGARDIFDIVTQLYGAYLCAHINTLSKCMTEQEFMAKVPCDWGYLGKINSMLAQKKKN
jgi:hypothetical protein